LRLDGALLAREAADVARRRSVRSEGVDEGARALVRAEVTDRLGVVLRRVAEVDRALEADEGGVPAPLDDAERLHGGADGAGLAAVRVDVDLGPGDALLDVVDLSLDG